MLRPAPEFPDRVRDSLGIRLRRVVLWQGGDNLDRFHADSDDLADEADDVLGIVGFVGVRDDAAALCPGLFCSGPFGA